ncbi:MAG TPA: hypothetical protein VFG84_06865 [Gemmatimonadaceae bacterium]|nr:hypothetical protein [Gemmatimonadaceae bacterium]
MLSSIRLLTLLVPSGALGAALHVTPAVAQTNPVTITEWEVPWGADTRPRDPYVAPDGRVFFVGQAGNYVAALEPSSGKFTRFEIDSGTHPHNLIVDSKGTVWYAGNRNAMIGQLDPATGQIIRHPMPNGVPRDPHTLLFDDREQNIWFTAQQAGKVGRLNMASGKLDIIDMATERARPYGIWLDSKGRPWICEFGTNKLAMIDPATLEVTEFPLPHERARARRLVVTPDDMVWYVDYTRSFLGRLDPKTGEVKEWQSPGGTGALPYAMSLDDKGRIWYVETGLKPSRLVGWDPKTEKFFSITPIAESGGLTVRHMYFDPERREFWFGTDAGTIARAKVP